MNWKRILRKKRVNWRKQMLDLCNWYWNMVQHWPRECPLLLSSLIQFSHLFPWKIFIKNNKNILKCAGAFLDVPPTSIPIGWFSHVIRADEGAPPLQLRVYKIAAAVLRATRRPVDPDVIRTEFCRFRCHCEDHLYKSSRFPKPINCSARKRRRRWQETTKHPSHERST